MKLGDKNFVAVLETDVDTSKTVVAYYKYSEGLFLMSNPLPSGMSNTIN